MNNFTTGELVHSTFCRAMLRISAVFPRQFVYPSVLLAYLHSWLDAYKSGNISETVEDRAKANGLYEVVHGFRLRPKCMTLNDL